MKQLNCILVIDDDATSNFAVKGMLAKMGIAKEVVVHADGQSAIDYLQQPTTAAKPTEPELILLDLDMPGMDGLDFLEAYRQLPTSASHRLDTVIAIVSSGLDFAKFKSSLAFSNSYMIEHLRKPIDQNDIIILLEEYFDWED